MNPLLSALLFGVLLPGAVAALGALGLVAAPAEAARRYGPPWVAAAAFIVGFWGVVGTPELSPLDVHHLLPHVAVLGATAATCELAFGGRAGLRWVARAAISLAVAWLILRPLLAHSWSGAGGVALLFACAASIAALVAILDHAAGRLSRRVSGATHVIMLGAVAACAAASGTLAVGQLGGAMAAAVGGLWLVDVVSGAPGRSPVTALTAVFAPAVVALAGFYASLMPAVAMLLGAMPVALLIAAVGASRLVRGRLAAAIPVAIVIATAAAAGAYAATSGADGAESGADEYDYGYD